MFPQVLSNFWDTGTPNEYFNNLSQFFINLRLKAFIRMHGYKIRASAALISVFLDFFVLDHHMACFWTCVFYCTYFDTYKL